MANTHETIAEIIAEKRQQADEIERDVSEKMKRNKMISDRYARELIADIRREADRLEAAHRRERGDAAKLREALVKCREIALQWLADEAAGVAGTTDKPHARSAAEAVVDMEFEINAALSAPPRNCDRFATVDEARKAHEEYRGDYIMRASNKFDFPMEFEAWLFAPAMEQEGGAK